MSQALDHFTSAAAKGVYSMDNLFPEPHYGLTGRGITFPDGAGEKLFNAAKNLVSSLNKMFHKEGDNRGGHNESFDLRQNLVLHTERLSQPSSGDPDNIRNQVSSAQWLQSSLKMLELNRNNPGAQEAAPKLREFIEIFAETEGASQYTKMALEEKRFDVEAVVKMEHPEGPYSMDNLFPEPHYGLVGKGMTFPDGANEKLFREAEDLVVSLNKMFHQDEGKGLEAFSHDGGHMASSELRENLVKHTARLSQPSSGDPDHIRNQVYSASYLQDSLKRLELDRNNPVAQEALPKLRQFIETFAETEGASKYTKMALEGKRFDVEAVIKMENGRTAIQPTQTKKAPGLG